MSLSPRKPARSGIPRSAPVALARDRVLTLSQTLLASLDTPKSLAVSLCIKYEDLAALNSLEFDPNHYLETDIEKCRFDLQAISLLSKCPKELFSAIDLKAKAIESFKQAELACQLANTSLWSSTIDKIVAKRPDGRSIRIVDVKNIMSRILGRAPNWISIIEQGGWGPGSSFLLAKRDASPDTKCEHDCSITYDLAKRLSLEPFDQLPRFFRRGWKLVPGNIVTTVPKNFKTDRTIAIEPAINSFCQKGIGNGIRSRLKKFGIDLNDQRYNQTAAEYAHQLQYATIDMKAASDSLSLALIERLMPSDWFDLVFSSRSHFGTLDSRKKAIAGSAEWFEYQKISSMGNGYTFELESAIFLALCLATGCDRSQIFVYGDDIIIPQRYVSTLYQLFDSFGLSVNKEKSFVNGNFFESCGGFFFCGVDITPFRIKDLPHEVENTIVLCNKIRETAFSAGFFSHCDRRFLSSYRLAVHWLPDCVRLFVKGPRGYGNGLWSNRSESNTVKHHKSRNALITMQLVPVLDKIEGVTESMIDWRLWPKQAVSSIYSTIVITTGNTVLVRLKTFRRVRAVVPQWSECYGPWQ